MTDNEIRQLRKSIISLRENGLDDNELKTIDTTLSCVDMINSILAYEYDFLIDANELLENELKRSRSYLNKYVVTLGKDVVVNLIKGQQNSIKTIKRNVYTDGDGCTYNSIVWND